MVNSSVPVQTDVPLKITPFIYDELNYNDYGSAKLGRWFGFTIINTNHSFPLEINEDFYCITSHESHLVIHKLCMCAKGCCIFKHLKGWLHFFDGMHYNQALQ